MNFIKYILLAFLSLLCLSTEASTIYRSGYQVKLFRKSHICPSTHEKSLKCPGYIVDHIRPLCAGGPDRPSNMQYQTYAASLRKDREERALCRSLRLAGK